MPGMPAKPAPASGPHPTLADLGANAGKLIEKHFDVICRQVLRGPDIVSAPGYFRMITREPHPLGNFVALDPSADGGTLLDAIKPLMSLGAPAAVVFTGGPEEELTRLLAERGFSLAETMPAMAADIDSIPPSSLPDGYRFSEIGASDDEPWCDAFAEGYEIPRPLATVFGPAATAQVDDGGRVHHYAISKDDAVVATSLVFLEGGLAGVYCVATRPAERGKGLGTFATAEPLRRLRSLGYRTGVLQSSSKGESIYRRLGFRHLGSLPLYVRMPA